MQEQCFIDKKLSKYFEWLTCQAGKSSHNNSVCWEFILINFQYCIYAINASWIIEKINDHWIAN